MDNTVIKTENYLRRGYCCAEAIVRAGLDMLGAENEQLAAAAATMCGGMHAGFACGALTGSALMLSLFFRSAALKNAAAELAQWFDDTYGMQYGSINCEDIAGAKKEYRDERCAPICLAVAEKCEQLLKESGLLQL